MARRLLISLIALAIAAITSVPKARAHGEAGDEPFLKDLTVAFYDVSIAPTAIQVGQPVTITGTVRILETWPYTLAPPETASIMPVVPGPVFALQDRLVNGQSATGSFFVDKGGIYQFKMVILGKEPGRWHVHPGIAVQGTGTLIGPGEWVTVQPSANIRSGGRSRLTGLRRASSLRESRWRKFTPTAQPTTTRPIRS